jgi:hypothetical protein
MSKHDRAWADYSERFRKMGLPKILSSAVTIQVYEGGAFDVQQATELGAILLLDKPLILLVLPEEQAPSRLAKAADVIIKDWVPESIEAQDHLMLIIRDLDLKERSR